MRTITIPRIGHRIKPIELNEDVIYTIDLIDQLDGDTINSHAFVVLDSIDRDVTANFAKDSHMISDVCHIGINAYLVGRYKIVLWFTCNEFLPNGVTNRKFKVELILTIR